MARGQLLMNGVAVEWPPADINGLPISIGDMVQGRSTLNLRDVHAFTVGGLRLQNNRGTLEWVVCAYDDADRYFEAYANECAIVYSL